MSLGGGFSLGLLAMIRLRLVPGHRASFQSEMAGGELRTSEGGEHQTPASATLTGCLSRVRGDLRK